MTGMAMGLALAVRVGYIVATPGYVPILDAEDFSRLGARIAAGIGFGVSRYAPGGGPTAYRPPLYPLLLGLVYRVGGVNFTSARLVQALLGTVTVGLIGVVAWRLWGARVGIVATVLAAVYPPLIISTTVLLSEGVGVLLEMMAVAAVIEYRRSRAWGWLLAAGAAVGAATLARPNYAVLLLPLAALTWSASSERRRRVLSTVALAGAAALVIAPWTARNLAVMQRGVILTTQTGYLLAGIYNEQARTDRTFPATWRSPAQVAETAALYRDTSLKEADMDQRQTQAALRYVGGHPTYPLEVAFWNTVYMSGIDLKLVELNTAGELGLSRRTALVTAGVLYVVEVLAIFGALTRRARQAPVWFWGIPIVLFATTILLQGAPRFRLPVDPFLVMLASLVVGTMADRLLPGRADRDSEPPGRTVRW